MKRALRTLAVMLGVVAVVVLAVFVAALVFVDLDALVNEQLAKAKPELEAKLGRRISVGPVRTQVFPALGGRVEAVAIEADPAHPEDDRPLLQLRSLRFELALLEAVRTLGEHLVVKSLVLDGLRVNVVRGADGRLSYQDIVERQEPEEAAADTSSSAPSDGLAERLRGLTVDVLRLDDAELRFVDHTQGGGAATEHVIRKLNLRLGGVRLDAPIALQLDAAVFGDTTNLELSATVGPLRELGGLPRIAGLSLEADDIDLASLAPLLSPSGVKVDTARLGADLQVGAVAPGRPVAATGFVTVKGLQLRGAARFDARAEGKVELDAAAGGAKVERLELSAGAVKLELTGTVADVSGTPKVDLTLATKPFTFDDLLRLFPAAAEALVEAQATATGQGSLQGHLKGTAVALDAALDVSLRGCKLDVPRAHVDGDLQLSMRAVGDPRGDLTASLDFDADQAVLVVPGSVNKSAATPWNVHASVVRTGERLDVKRLDLRLAELSLAAAGRLSLDGGATALRIDMPRVDLEQLARTVTALPAQRLKGGFLDAKVTLEGNPRRLETLRLAMRPLAARLGRSDFSGEVTLENLDAPRAQVALRSSLVDLDELYPPTAPAPASGAPGPTAPSKVELDDPSLKTYRFAGSLDAKRVVVRGEELTDFRGQIRLEDGVLTLEDCAFGLYDGRVSAKGTSVEVWKARMPFRANLSVKGVEASRVLAAKTRWGGVLQGKADFESQLTGDGFTTTQLEERLVGNMVLALKDGHLGKAGLTEAVLGDFQALEQVPGLSLQRLQASNTMKDFLARVEVKDGKMALVRPITFSLDGNRVLLDGAVGVAGGLFLTGQYFVSPSLVDRLTGGRCRSTEQLPVPVKVTGTWAAPVVEPDGKAIALTLAQRCLAELATGKLLPGVGRAGAPAGPALPDAAALQEAAGARAKAEQERLAKERAELERKAREALEAQKKRMGDTLEGLFKRR